MNRFAACRSKKTKATFGRPERNERGFTLVELLVAVVIEAMLLAALGSALFVTMRSTTNISQSLDRTADARIAANYVISDAQNSSGPETSIGTSTCTDASPPVTGTATPIVEFKSSSTSSTGAKTAHVIDYLLVGTSVLRRECQGASTVAVGDHAIASNITSMSVACSPTADCSGTPTSITATVNEVADSTGTVYSYKLTGAFRKVNSGGAPTATNPQSVVLLGAGSTCSGSTDTINISGSATMKVYGAAYINTADSASCYAMQLAGSGTWSAGSTNIFTGGSCKSPGSWLPCPTVTTFSPRVTDPYASLTAPSTSGLTVRTGCSGAQASQTASPGLYSSGFDLGGGNTCTLASGVYVVQGGFHVGNGATLKTAAGGVLIYLMSGAFAIDGGSNVTLTAATTGTYAGLAVWQAAADTTTMTFSNGGALLFNGAIYAPKAQLNISGNAQTPLVTALVVATIVLSNSGGITVGSASATPLSISTTSLPSWTVGKAYSTTVVAAGGDGNYTFAMTGLPAGLTYDASSGIISGTPTASGTSSVSITLSDALGDTPASKTLSLVINAAPTISTTSLPDAVYGTAYSTTLAASGGASPFTWTASPLPAGLSLNASTGVISGTATGSGTTTVSVGLTDSANNTATKSLTLTVDPVISSVVLANKAGGTAGQIEAGDTITVVFSAPMKVSSFCSTWANDANNQTLNADNLVTVAVSSPNGNKNDVLTVTTASGCTFNFGSIDLGSSGYASVAATFKGAGASKSTIAWTAGTHTLVITLGVKTAGTMATVNSSVPVFTASGSIQDTNSVAIVNSPFTVPAAKQF